jgi:hypothetical protein
VGKLVTALMGYPYKRTEQTLITTGPLPMTKEEEPEDTDMDEKEDS